MECKDLLGVNGSFLPRIPGKVMHVSTRNKLRIDQSFQHCFTFTDMKWLVDGDDWDDLPAKCKPKLNVKWYMMVIIFE